MGPVRASISIATKIEVIDWIEKNGGVASRAAAHFKAKGWKIRERDCRKWWSDRIVIRCDFDRSFRLSGGGRKPVLGALENELLDLITERRLRKEKVTRAWIADIAIAISITVGLKDFVASDGWLAGFMRRNDLTLRKVTNMTTLADTDVCERAVSYMQYLSSLRSLMNPECTVLMDETAVYFEDPRHQTVNQIGAHHVVIKSTGFQSMRITAILSVTASGIRQPPMLIWKGCEPTTSRVNGCIVLQQKRAWVDQSVLIKWIDLALPVLWTGTKHLVWDSMRAHIGKDVKAHCAKRQIDMCVIPGGMTPYLQAGDIGIYKSFKDNIAPLIDMWKRSDKVQYTKGGNPKPPSVDVVSSWVRDAWRAVPDHVIQMSIKRAGFVDDVGEWHISRHDVYGEGFRDAWRTASVDPIVRPPEIDESNALCEAIDDISLIDP